MTSSPCVSQVYVRAHGRPTVFAGVAFRSCARTQPAPLGSAELAELEALKPQSVSDGMLALLEAIERPNRDTVPAPREAARLLVAC